MTPEDFKQLLSYQQRRRELGIVPHPPSRAPLHLADDRALAVDAHALSIAYDPARGVAATADLLAAPFEDALEKDRAEP